MIVIKLLSVVIKQPACSKNSSAPVTSSANYRYSQWRSNTGALLGFHDAGQLTGHQGRYSYIKNSREELHLKIERVTLEDDGQFELPPKAVRFTNYQPGGVVDVNEDIPLNITCEAPNAKPEVAMTWYINGRKIEEGVQHWSSYNLNKTVTSYAALQWRAKYLLFLSVAFRRHVMFACSPP
ncbi:unnamed protein product [Heligmosomoides polygyrus]|uniref:Ig-like domain-containing protein n=1 Tax=Heligmosomoides polygyrus TaxID=6339 RepID=A0A183FL25_HELPZ|nr:unnamed protein product [Heligmosomoides polygyrus]